MNVFEKLTAARLFFMNAGAKKSGRNAFAKYDYFELADILPVANRAAKEIGFACIVRFGKEEATLEFVDTEKPEDRIVFASPMSTADLKGCHPVQSLGAVETYTRRYLYLACFEITECDALDATAGQPPARKDAQAKGAQGKNYTKSQADEMREILESKYASGIGVFNPADRDIWRKKLLDLGGEAALAELKAEQARRMGS